MNEKDQRQEQNLGRLIQAGFSQSARPEAAAREEGLRRLQEIWRAKYGAATRSREQAETSGAAAAKVSTVEPDVCRIRPEQSQHQNNKKYERNTLVKLIIRNRWGFGLGAAAAAAAIIVMLGLATPRAQAKAAEVMAKGAQAIAKLTTLHLRGQLRTLPQDNFSYINPDCEFYPIELWKQFDPQLKWRAEKPQRVAVMDGQSTLMLIKTANLAIKVPQAARSAFDTDWLHKIADLSKTLTNELNNALAKNWKLGLTQESAADGHAQTVVTIEAKSGVPDNDYLKNTFMMNADTRRVYRFNAQTELLEGVQIYLTRASGDTLIFDLQQIDYNQPIEAAVFNLELPANVRWFQNEMQKLPDNEKYASMTPEQATRAYFEAFAHQDWVEADKFRRDSVDDRTKEIVGGLELISVGTAFTSQGYPGRLVPYEIKLKSGEVTKHNLALKKDQKTGRWWVDGGGF